MDEKPLTKEDILDILQEYNKSTAFTHRQITDTPVDSYETVNRRYVTRNGTFATRPAGAVTGQFYLATDLATNGLAGWYNGSSWISATGSILGAGL